MLATPLRRRFWSATATVLLAFCSSPAVSTAATIHVDDDAVIVADDGLCSLREAMRNALADSQADNTNCPAGNGDDTIVLADDEEYVIPDADPANADNGLPVVTTAIIILPDTLTIRGRGASIVREGGCLLDGTQDAGEFRLFEVDEGVLFLEDLTLEGGCADGGGASGSGGAIRVFRGVLNLERVVIEGNMARQKGGGLSMDESGGQFEDSTFRGNSASGDGGALDNTTSQLMIDRSTFSGNSSGGDGGGIATTGSSPETRTILRNSTVSGNVAANAGGGLDNTGEMQIDACTLFGNSATGPLGGGIQSSGLLILNNSITAGNTGGDCATSGTFAANGLGFDSDGTCAAEDADVQTVTVDALALGPLADHGGFTETHALGFGSVAIDAVDDCLDTAGDPLTFDQRNFDRPQDGDGDGMARCDVGAVEAGEVVVVDGSCALGDAIAAANQDGTVGGCVSEATGDDTLVLDIDTTLTAADTVRSTVLQGAFAGTPDITSPISIRAGQASVIERSESLGCDTPDGTDEFRLLQVLPGHDDARLELVGLTLRGGCADRGGAVLASHRLDIVDSTFLVNTARSLGEAKGGAVFAAESTVHVSGSLFQNNLAAGDTAFGGALAVDSPVESLEESQFLGNSAQATGGTARGGAVHIAFEATGLRELVFESNLVLGSSAAEGGGLWVGSVESMERVLLRGNDAVGAPGTGSADGGTARGGGAYLGTAETVDGLTVIDNSAVGGNADMGNAGDAEGGGLYLDFEGTLRTATVSGNTAQGGQSVSGQGGSASGGGVQLDGAFRLEQATVAENEAIAGLGGGDGTAVGGGLLASEAIMVGSSLLEQNTVDTAGAVSSSDCDELGSLVTSLGHNAVAEPTTCDFTAVGDQVAVAASLLPLGDHGCVSPLPNGECPPTHPVALGSDAIDTGSCTASGVGTDIRELVRPIDIAGSTNADDGCDVGAYESRDLDEGVGDGVEDGVDNCPAQLNPSQQDSDSDGSGDVCDLCTGDDTTGDADADGTCADLDCDDSDPSTVDCLLFSDDFEDGTLGAWSNSVP